MYNSGSQAGWRGKRVSRPAVYTFSETPEGTHQSCCCSVATHQSTMLWKPSRGSPLKKIPLIDTLSSFSQLPYHLQFTNSHFSCLSYCPASSVVLIPSTANCFPFCCTMWLVGFFFLTAPHSPWDPNSLTRGRTQAPCIGRWSLNHWTPREVPCGILVPWPGSGPGIEPGPLALRALAHQGIPS